MTDAERIAIEKEIAERVVTDALARGWLISVSDGEEWPVRRSDNKEQIIAALASTDSDTLVFREKDLTKVGFVLLIYGNGVDLISDHSANDAMDNFFEPITNWIDNKSEWQ